VGGWSGRIHLPAGPYIRLIGGEAQPPGHLLGRHQLGVQREVYVLPHVASIAEKTPAVPTTGRCPLRTLKATGRALALHRIRSGWQGGIVISFGSFVGVSALSLGMVLTPGPNMMYVVSRSISQGRRAGLISLAGVGLGFLAYITATTLGV